MNSRGFEHLYHHVGSYLQTSERVLAARQQELQRRMAQESEDSGQLLARLMRQERDLKELSACLDQFAGVGSQFFNTFNDVQRLMLQMQALRNLLPADVDTELPHVAVYLRASTAAKAVPAPAPAAAGLPASVPAANDERTGQSRADQLNGAQEPAVADAKASDTS
jgi:hypothetical protein